MSNKNWLRRELTFKKPSSCKGSVHGEIGGLEYMFKMIEKIRYHNHNDELDPIKFKHINETCTNLHGNIFDRLSDLGCSNVGFSQVYLDEVDNA